MNTFTIPTVPHIVESRFLVGIGTMVESYAFRPMRTIVKYGTTRNAVPKRFNRSDLRHALIRSTR